MPSLPSTLVGCTVLRNEARYCGGLEFRDAAVGFQHFFLYDDASTDTLAQAVEPHVRRHLVTLHANFTSSAYFWQSGATGTNGPGTVGHAVGKFLPQSAMVRHCITRHGHLTAWMAFVDVDEYMYPRHETPPLPKQLSHINLQFGMVRLKSDVASLPALLHKVGRDREPSTSLSSARRCSKMGY